MVKGKDEKYVEVFDEEFQKEVFVVKKTVNDIDVTEFLMIYENDSGEEIEVETTITQNGKSYSSLIFSFFFWTSWEVCDRAFAYCWSDRVDCGSSDYRDDCHLLLQVQKNQEPKKESKEVWKHQKSNDVGKKQKASF